ncbi:Rrf2 family transcriptional regulator [Rickettsiales bacterium LUAb2]
MAANSKFAVAVHALTVLAYFDNTPLTSNVLASSVNTNAVVIRVIMAKLKKAGLVKAQIGSHGGLSLAKPAEQITLADIYAAITTEGFAVIHSNPKNPKCPISSNIKPILQEVFATTNKILSDNLEHITLLQLVTRISNKEML